MYKALLNRLDMNDKHRRLCDLEKIGQVYYFVVPITIFLILSWFSYLSFDQVTIRTVSLVQEDGPIEYLTAICFFVASLIFLMGFVSHRNKWLLILGILMFIGAGEEISWGERILGYETPQLFENHSVQTESNIHNLEIFNSHSKDGNLKTGFAKLITINFLFKLFWLIYCVILPVAFAYIPSISRIIEKTRLPIPPLSIGIFFLVNWWIFRAVINVFSLFDNNNLYRVPEVLELVSGFLFMTLALFYLINGPTKYLETHSEKANDHQMRQSRNEV